MFRVSQGRRQALLRWSDLKCRYRLPIIAFIFSLIGSIGWSAFYHHSLFMQAEKARVAALSKTRQQQTLDELLARQQALSGQAQVQADARAPLRGLQQKNSMAETAL
ncbi:MULTISPECIES: hypothetical protein [Tenebrionibacter/Tenebrionicola group]|jgi:hypothetical protein|uniref:Uncharacterized protein n=2 Tax=Tenebrionibacter/Tenebrionicola group TaxID=2969848 RepID=A0A8K0XXC9_9ENTR|nr:MULTISPECIES: hypothetical protein [Tenebrionibacter/Tenebrionicola group]MBK4716460.1 hypothetical protein [Tenebrionibacter intestinalis]MBV5096794.1 hypothetical protein [Tenebrionicola larvae]